MNSSRNKPFFESTNPFDRQKKPSEFSAHSGAVENGRLVFISSARQVRFSALLNGDMLFRARIWHQAARLWQAEGSITIQYADLPDQDQPDSHNEPLAEISLSASTPWEIEFRNGVSRLKARLEEIQLRSLDILGGASQVELALAEPAETTFIYISGGIRQANISRPGGVGMRIQISGGANEVLFDDQQLNLTGGELYLESSNFSHATGKYVMCITGGASKVKIVELRRNPG